MHLQTEYVHIYVTEVIDTLVSTRTLEVSDSSELNHSRQKAKKKPEKLHLEALTCSEFAGHCCSAYCRNWIAVCWLRAARICDLRKDGLTQLASKGCDQVGVGVWVAGWHRGFKPDHPFRQSGGCGQLAYFNLCTTVREFCRPE